ncbi:hypothetical protein GCK72_012008 [Caenorhabditis remanei]|uniref:Uncharacterized protein n=1 Tax=Caenorhabditis remanei TaxID=31234 RepID=A0A6A5GJX1_CAERE|nr:hypothetical protein GCK72_012008 [Caenorhabditis remanei]KAF1755558.1 hypothetical protein GCK72_012008 [Caenorhabditis remanei]
MMGRRKRFLDAMPLVNLAKGFIDAIKKPENVFGKASNMNMLTWNRRLSQLAMTEKANIEKNDIKRIEYKGKIYRINKYGTLATYFISHALGGFIADMFQAIRVGYLACKLWFSKVKIPSPHENTTIGDTHEMLFADRTEVGCFFTWPDTICIIGPLNATIGYLYEKGDTCSACKYGCTNNLCNPSPDYFYAMREKYQKHLNPKIEKFEVVEGFDGQPPVLGKNFMIDSANYSNILMISILMVSLFLLLRNKF